MHYLKITCMPLSFPIKQRRVVADEDLHQLQDLMEVMKENEKCISEI